MEYDRRSFIEWAGSAIGAAAVLGGVGTVAAPMALPADSMKLRLSYSMT